MAERVLFSWLHLSDIHFGHGNAAVQWDQRVTTSALIRDIKSRVKASNFAPPPQALFLTGDIAFSGDRKQYDLAGQWLQTVLESLELSQSRLYIIPGNHDVQRTYREADRQAFRLLTALRSGQELMDEALQDSTDRLVLTRRFENYLRFANEFAPSCLRPLRGPEQWLFWSHHLQPQPDINFRIHLVGLNTALLCNDNNDEGKLSLGVMQSDSVSESPGEGEVLMVLSHHPFEFLAPASNEQSRVVEKRADLHLWGHVHRPKITRIEGGDGKGAVRVVAGAVHGDPGEKEKQGYIYGAIVENGGNLELRLWPRLWIPEQLFFGRDQNNLPQDQDFSSLRLRSVALPEKLTTPADEPVLTPLAAFLPRLQRTRWILDANYARDWLCLTGLDQPEVLFAGNIIVEQVGSEAGEPVSGQQADQRWKSSLIDHICDRALQRSGSNFTPILFHGIRGVGKTTLLLRYLAASKPGDVRILFDCGSNADLLQDGVEDYLSKYLETALQQPGGDVFVAVDGLDVACRRQVVLQGLRDGKGLLRGHIWNFRNAVRSVILRGRRVHLAFTCDDPPEWGRAVEWSPKWAIPCFREIVEGKNWNGLSCRLDPPTDREREIVKNILPASDEQDLSDRPFLKLPVFLDAARGIGPQELQLLNTKQQALERARTCLQHLDCLKHSYYGAMAELSRFKSALNDLGSTAGKETCVALMTQELTGDWIYLFQDQKSNFLISRLGELHSWLISVPWRYSNSYVLSNVLTSLAVLESLRVNGTKYSCCNLRNARIINGAQIVDSEFRAVDLGGAQFHRATVNGGKFVGVDFSGARFEDFSMDSRSKFIGCKIDSDTFGNLSRGREAQFIECELSANGVS